MNIIINDFDRKYDDIINKKINILREDNYIFLLSDDISKYKIKDEYPTNMFILGIRNIDFNKSMNYSLEYKANLTLIFGDEIIVHDPLGNIWYKGINEGEAFDIIIHRLNFLNKMTKKKTQPNNNKNLKLNWYFDPYQVEMNKINGKVEIPSVQEFLDIVTEYAKQYYDLVPSMQYNPQFKRTMRCRRGMPSFRFGSNIVVSKRIITNEFITQDDLVVTYTKDNNIYYYGDDKPSIDTPIHIKLYDEYKNINFILHSHEYIDGAPYTEKSIPCGAIEEADKIIKTINKNYCNNSNFYIINELGHGSIILSKNIELLKNIKIKKRPMPEIIFERKD